MAYLPYGDNWYFEVPQADGTIKKTALTGRWGLADRGGFGSPPHEYITQTHYGSTGERVLQYNLGPRSLTFTITNSDIDTRSEYWAEREELLNIARPNQYEPVRIIVNRTDGTKRALDIRPDGGAEFPAGENHGSAIIETTSWIAHNPLWYNPERKIITVDSQSDTGTSERTFVFKLNTEPSKPHGVTFPATFGYIAGYSTPDLSYRGTFTTHPLIHIYGPCSGASIMNLATEVGFTLDGSILEGDYRRIEYVFGKGYLIQDSEGNSRYNELGIESNLLDFNIRPNNLIKYTQKIRVSISGTGTGTRWSIEYYERFYGI